MQDAFRRRRAARRLRDQRVRDGHRSARRRDGRALRRSPDRSRRTTRRSAAPGATAAGDRDAALGLCRRRDARVPDRPRTRRMRSARPAAQTRPKSRAERNSSTTSCAGWSPYADTPAVCGQPFSGISAMPPRKSRAARAATAAGASRLATMTGCSCGRSCPASRAPASATAGARSSRCWLVSRRSAEMLRGCPRRGCCADASRDGERWIDVATAAGLLSLSDDKYRTLSLTAVGRHTTGRVAGRAYCTAPQEISRRLSAKEIPSDARGRSPIIGAAAADRRCPSRVAPRRGEAECHGALCGPATTLHAEIARTASELPGWPGESSSIPASARRNWPAMATQS